MIQAKNTVGRPQEYDRIKIGRDFVQWAKDHPDCLTVPHFTSANGLTTTRLLTWYDDDPEFRVYYLEAKEQIGINRLNATRITEEKEQLTGKKALDKTIYLRHVNNFDPDKRKFDREEKAYESSLKEKEQKTVTPELTAQMDAVIEQITRMRDKK